MQQGPPSRPKLMGHGEAGLPAVTADDPGGVGQDPRTTTARHGTIHVSPWADDRLMYQGLRHPGSPTRRPVIIPYAGPSPDQG